MTKGELESWASVEYNEGTREQLIYYLNEKQCCVGDVAYLQDFETDSLTKLQIVKIVIRSNNTALYDSLGKYALIEGEHECNADTSAEFITDNDCYLVWFNYA